eukprot:scaffold2459_cov225-Ochromonas_danica.AAC.2
MTPVATRDRGTGTLCQSLAFRRCRRNSAARGRPATTRASNVAITSFWDKPVRSASWSRCGTDRVVSEMLSGPVRGRSCVATMRRVDSVSASDRKLVAMAENTTDRP